MALLVLLLLPLLPPLLVLLLCGATLLVPHTWLMVTSAPNAGKNRVQEQM